MGNRPQRSTEVALEFLLEQIYTTWNTGNIATVLSLDISGAFDTVNHLRLLDNLRKKRIPPWLVRFTRSFLQERSTTLVVDSYESEPRRLSAGVPQGSLLSPILFLFYNAPLLDLLDKPAQLLSPLGFADDINLLSYNATAAQNSTNLDQAHDQCLAWAKTHGMHFAPDKYHLTHFTRKRRADLSAPVLINGTMVQPEPILRILGVTLDKRLNWESHIKETSQKMGPQLQALLRTTASTWGATLAKARQIYTAVIRSSIAYAAPIWHKPPKHITKARGPVSKLQTYQNQCLRIVTGAYKATPVRQLETEAFIPPLDLWLNGRLALFQARLERTGMAQLIHNACETIRTRIRNRRPRGHRLSPPPPTPGQLRKAWVKKW
jgi:hypothetical protein